MKLATKFSLSPKWKMLLLDMGVDPHAVLVYANLPEDLFSRSDIQLSTEQYFALWRAIEMAAEGEEVGLLLAKYMSAESFDVPIFAALCCQNLNMALDRLSHYKPLIGPLTLSLTRSAKSTSFTLVCNFLQREMPYALCMSEAVFFTQLARIGTRKRICPESITIPVKPNLPKAYEAYFGCDILFGETLSLTFNASDAALPFLTSSDSMWSFFEDSLNKRLEDLTKDSTTADRVEAILMKALPSGEAGIDYVANKLAVSKRTLQRKLTDEAVSFQSLLISVREKLAQHYLVKSDMSLGEISYLLGFKEPNSFIRAFSGWQGVSPSMYRTQNKH